MVVHPINPVYDGNSKILILGSFPSVKSRESNFFYAHKKNRFWAVLASLFKAFEPRTTEEKKNFLLEHGVALWDVIASCEITGSSDSSIRNVTPNDITPIVKSSKIEKIFTNGKTAEKYFNLYI